ALRLGVLGHLVRLRVRAADGAKEQEPVGLDPLRHRRMELVALAEAKHFFPHRSSPPCVSKAAARSASVSAAPSIRRSPPRAGSRIGQCPTAPQAHLFECALVSCGWVTAPPAPPSLGGGEARPW